MQSWEDWVSYRSNGEEILDNATSIAGMTNNRISEISSMFVQTQ